MRIVLRIRRFHPETDPAPHDGEYPLDVEPTATILDALIRVKNEQDGSLRVVAEGPRADLEVLLEALREGPASAIVEYVAEDWLPYTGHWGTFGIRSSGHRGD